MSGHADTIRRCLNRTPLTWDGAHAHVDEAREALDALVAENQQLRDDLAISDLNFSAQASQYYEVQAENQRLHDALAEIAKIERHSVTPVLDKLAAIGDIARAAERVSA